MSTTADSVIDALAGWLATDAIADALSAQLPSLKDAINQVRRSVKAQTATEGKEEDTSDSDGERWMSVRPTKATPTLAPTKAKPRLAPTKATPTLAPSEAPRKTAPMRGSAAMAQAPSSGSRGPEVLPLATKAAPQAPEVRKIPQALVDVMDQLFKEAKLVPDIMDRIAVIKIEKAKAHTPAVATTGAGADRKSRLLRSKAAGRTLVDENALKVEAEMRDFVKHSRLLHTILRPNTALPQCLQPKSAVPTPRGVQPRGGGGSAPRAWPKGKGVVVLPPRAMVVLPPKGVVVLPPKAMLVQPSAPKANAVPIGGYPWRRMQPTPPSGPPPKRPWPSQAATVHAEPEREAEEEAEEESVASPRTPTDMAADEAEGEAEEETEVDHRMEELEAHCGYHGDGHWHSYRDDEEEGWWKAAEEKDKGWWEAAEDKDKGCWEAAEDKGWWGEHHGWAP